MPRMTEDEYLAYLAKSNASRREAIEIAEGTPEPDAGPEVNLHDKIAAECRRRGWAYVHSRMDAPTTTAKGVCDFVIAASRGRTLWIECKSRTGKQTPAQLGFALQCERQGHAVHVVRSFQEFLNVVDRL